MISVVIRHKDTGIIAIQAIAMTFREDSVWLKTLDGPHEARLAEIDWMAAICVGESRS